MHKNFHCILSEIFRSYNYLIQVLQLFFSCTIYVQHLPQLDEINIQWHKMEPLLVKLHQITHVHATSYMF